MLNAAAVIERSGGWAARHLSCAAVSLLIIRAARDHPVATTKNAREGGAERRLSGTRADALLSGRGFLGNFFGPKSNF
jgi:hypothetical protein